MQRLRVLLLLLPLLLSACKDITHVQTGYVADRDECRANAENHVGVYSQPEAYALSDKERSTALLQLFCECMKGKDWKVAGCPKPPTAVAATPAPAPAAPTVVIVQSPTAQPALLAPEPTPAVKKKKKPGYCPPPQNTCPAPDDSNPSPTPVQENQQLQYILQKQ